MGHESRLDLREQVAIVTGGGGGIGRATALGLADAGATVVVGDIVPERCDEVVETIRAAGGTALGVPTDVMDTDQVRALCAAADDAHGRIDILVNNAGGVSARPFLEQSERSWRRHVDINLTSMFAAVSAAVPVMIRGGRGGVMVNSGNKYGQAKTPHSSRTDAIQAGVIHLPQKTEDGVVADRLQGTKHSPDHKDDTRRN